MYPRIISALMAVGIALTALLVGPSVVAPGAAPQAQAANEEVANSIASTKTISIAITERSGRKVTYLARPGISVNAGADRITSFWCPSNTQCRYSINGRSGTAYNGTRVDVPLGSYTLVVAKPWG